MGKHEKLLRTVLAGSSDVAIPFQQLCSLLSALGFHERIRGSHHIFTYDGLPEIINLQPSGSSAKSCQVRQVREILKRLQLDGRVSDDG